MNTPDELIDVYVPWHRDPGPGLSMGRLTAAARSFDGGRLRRQFRIHRPLEASDVVGRLVRSPRPTVLLLSDYVWSIERNLQLAREARAANPNVLVVHGGPSAPSRPAAAADFLVRHRDAADVLARGEGETLVCDLLAALGAAGGLDVTHLAGVAGLTIRMADGSVVRTPDRERLTDLGAHPSPYAQGEFDDIDPDAFVIGVTVETNRGCPYGCTFCDWGSATMSRVRLFPFDQVVADFRWACERRAQHIVIADANFGMTRRDAELIDALVEIKDETGFPNAVSFAPAKNTVRHLVRIMETLSRHGIYFEASVGVQTFDPDTLVAIDRTNISTGRMLDLSREMRDRDLPLPFELIAGLPGQTVESLSADLQTMFDAELSARVHTLRVLPNAPIGDPEYQRRHGLEFDEAGFARAAASYTPEDQAWMTCLIRMMAIIDHFAVLRLVARWLQWDHSVPAVDFAGFLIRASDEGQLGAFTAATEDLLLGRRAPVDWGPALDEVAELVSLRLGVARSTASEAVFAAQQHLLPAPDRHFPSTISLAHDVVEYARGAGWGLLGNGSRGRPASKLDALGRGELTVHDDPLLLCDAPRTVGGPPLPPSESETTHLMASCYELLSPLTSPTAFFRMRSEAAGREELEEYRRFIRTAFASR